MSVIESEQLRASVKSFVQEMNETIEANEAIPATDEISQASKRAYIDGIKLAVNRLMNIADGIQKAEALANR